mgnify:CR=1 FL=1
MATSRPKGEGISDEQYISKIAEKLNAETDLVHAAFVQFGRDFEKIQRYVHTERGNY